LAAVAVSAIVVIAPVCENLKGAIECVDPTALIERATAI
jgi:hypothetical protein